LYHFSYFNHFLEYRYWKAFTTGKPASLGGIPHDTYGMTTRGVHRYVLSCLEKLGLKEEEVTKVSVYSNVPYTFSRLNIILFCIKSKL
jgi:hypothetical protein